MHNNVKRSLDEEPIRLLLTGVVRSGRFYYKADPVTGLHTLFPARLELMKIGMSQQPAKRLLTQAVASGLIRETKINFELEAELKRVAKDSKTHGEDDDEDSPQRREPDEQERPFASVNQGRYQLVSRNSGFFGWYDTKTDSEHIVSRDREEVLSLIEQMSNAQEKSRTPSAGRFNT